MGYVTFLLPLEADLHGWPPGADSFNSRPIFPGAGMDWFNNHLIQAILGALIVIGLWLWFAKGQKVVPGKKQLLGELTYDFLRNFVARDNLGSEYRRYLPFLISLFSFILINNLFGQFFVFMFPTFSKIGYAWGLAILAWLLYNGAGIKKHGLVGYLKLQTMPAGVPLALLPIIIPLEVLSNFIVRPITLGLRLFGNLFAGHLVIMVFVVGGGILLSWKDNFIYNIAGGVSFLFSFAIFALEIFVGILQAYIFTVLTAQYISSAIAEEH